MVRKRSLRRNAAPPAHRRVPEELAAEYIRLTWHGGGGDTVQRATQSLRAWRVMRFGAGSLLSAPLWRTELARNQHFPCLRVLLMKEHNAA